MKSMKLTDTLNNDLTTYRTKHTETKDEKN